MSSAPASYTTLAGLNCAIVDCRLCPRLVTYREDVARVKRRAFLDQSYWGKPIPGWGDPDARVWIVGLAPAAHGGNRTGRIFTGDRSGDFLYAALHRAGFANQPTSVSNDDGLQMTDVYLSAAVRCAPPDNKPLPEEFTACRPYLAADLRLLTHARVVLALGKIAFDAAVRTLSDAGQIYSGTKPIFGHNVAYTVGRYHLISSYHPSQRNTQTGLLTADMMDQVLLRVKSSMAVHSDSDY